MSVDAALLRLQVIAKACTSVSLKGAPLHPVDAAMGAPFSIVHLATGQGTPQNGTVLKFNPTAQADFYFSPTNTPNAFKDMDALALEYMQRLCGDPTLAGAVETIVFPVTFEVGFDKYDMVDFYILSFSIPLKTLETPTVTA